MFETFTPVALFKPLLVAKITKVTVLPIAGVIEFIVLVTLNSATGTGVTLAVLVLFKGIGSTSFPEIVAVLL